MSVLRRPSRFIAPTSGPQSSLIMQWFTKAVVPWIIPFFKALQDALDRVRDDGVVDIRDVIDVGAAAHAVALATGIDALPENTTIRNPGADVQLEQTLHVANHAGLRLISDREPRPNGGGNSPVFRWNGENGGRMVFLDQCVNVEVSGYTFNLDAHVAGTGPTAAVALDIDGYNGPRPTDLHPYYGMGSRCLVKRNLFHLARPSSCEMVRVSETVTSNQEYHAIEDCQFDGGLPGPGEVVQGTAVKLGKSANAKALQINGTSMQFFATAIHLLGGSAHMGKSMFCNFTSNGIDVLREGASECSCLCANSEHSEQFLVDRSGYGFTILSASRLDPSACPPGKGYIEAGGRLTIEGNVHFEEGLQPGARLFDLTRCRSFLALGLDLPDHITLDQVGFLTMPLEEWRFLISIGHSPIKLTSDPNDPRLLPPIYIRGKIGMEYVTGSDDVLLDLVLHAAGAGQNLTVVRAIIEQAQNASRGNYTGVEFGYRRTGGGDVQSLTPYKTSGDPK